MAVKQPGLRGEMNAVAAQVCVVWVVLMAFLAWTNEQMLRFPVGRVCWASTGVTATTTAAAMATTLSLPRTGSAMAPTASRTAIASLGAEKEAKGDKQGEGGSKGREAILFVFLLLVYLPHRNFASTGIHKLSDFTHHFLGKR
jgi:hypothetical protein